MQLAATHRPHPPPVPPRPSRQVVAEALKRTPRLPCPTRQAPPPPNTKPWRPGDKTDNNVSAGRTVIYESSRITKDQPTKCNERTSDPEKTQECRGRSERIVNHRERQQQLTELIVNGNENSVRFGIKEEATGIHSDRKDSASDVFARVQGTEDNAEGNEQVCEDFDVIKKSFEVRGSGTGRKDTSLSSTGIRTKVQVNDNGDEIGGDNLTHVLVGKPRENSVATVATVVVVEEPERKVTINEDNKDNKDNKDSKDSKDNIQHQDWLEAGVRYSSTKITLAGDDSLSDRGNDYDNFQGDKLVDAHKNDEAIKISLDFSSIRERIAMSSLQGLPPLPRSLSGFNLNEVKRENEPPPPPPTRSSSKTPKGCKTPQQSSSRPSPPNRQLTTLDTQLAILRKEMFGLRQLDLSLLSQLWSLNESIQEFRHILQEQEDRAPSSSPSSEDGEDGYHGHPPPPPRRPAPLLHHHRPPRPPRPLRPPPSDESPSSEEYGAI